MFKPHKRTRRYQTPFKAEDRELFMWNYECWKCGQNHWDCLHHILGGEFPEASSPLNAAPLNNAKCHIGNGHHFSREEDIAMLKKTYSFLNAQGYQFTEKDNKFIQIAQEKLNFTYDT